MNVWSNGKFSLLCFGAVVLMTGAAAKPAYVASTVNLRAAPGTGSEIVAKIPGGSLVDASACDGGWCEIAWQDKRGFAIRTALDMSGRVPQQRAAAVAPRTAYRQGPDVIEGQSCRGSGLLQSAGGCLLRRSALPPMLQSVLVGGVTGGDGYFVCCRCQRLLSFGPRIFDHGSVRADVFSASLRERSMARLYC
jgi:hypothetical protein